MSCQQRLDWSEWTGKTEAALIHSLQYHRLLAERRGAAREHSCDRGPITALTWALQIGEVRQFSEKSSDNTVQRTPPSKQRNKQLQITLIEAAKMAHRYGPTLALLWTH